MPFGRLHDKKYQEILVPLFKPLETALKTANAEISQLKYQMAEKDATISALSKKVSDIEIHQDDLETDISKHVEKSPENFEKSKKIFFTKNGTYVKKYIAGHLCTKFEEFVLIYEAMIAKNGFDLLLAVN